MRMPPLAMPRWTQPASRVAAHELPAWAPTALPLAGYFLFALLWLGRTVAVHPRSRVLGDAGPDKTIYMWSFEWWPHALVHAHDPFNATVVWAPHGIDLAWVTSVPGAALLLAPVTETLGPVFAYNLAALGTLALSAWTAYLLARRLTGQSGPSLVAGFVYGFSSYMIGQSTGHVNLTLVFLVPVAALLAVAFVAGTIERRRYAVLLGIVLTFQFLFSNEIFVTLTVIAGVAWLIARWQLPELRERFGALALSTLLAYCIAGVLLLPYLAHAFGGGTAPARRGHVRASTDVLNFVVPTRRTWLRPPHAERIRQRFTSHGAEQGAYLGLPLIAIIGLSVFQRRRRVQTIVLWSGVAAAVATLGPRVHVDGRDVGTGLWKLLDDAPFVRYALPIRLTMYVSLFAALACALWLAAPGGRRGARWALAAAAVIALLPNPATRLWAARVPTSSFFESGAYRGYVARGDTVLALPYGPAGWTMLWQADAGFRFRLVGGHLGHHIIRPECKWYWDYRALAGVDPPGGAAEFRRFLLAHRVREVLEGPRTPPKIKRLLAASLPDVAPTRVLDTVVLHLDPALPETLPANAPALPPPTKQRKRVLPPECAGAVRPSSTGTAGSP